MTAIASVAESVPAPILPDVDFDWSEETWDRIGRKTLELVTAASTGWDKRRPSPSEHAQEVRERVRTSLPNEGASPELLVESLRDDLLPLSTFNGHPRFYSYITSSPNPMGVMGDFISSAFNQNTSLWRASPLASAIELQTVDWLREILGMPETTEGVFSSGGQMANIIAHNVIRDQRAGWDVRRYGLRGEDGHASALAIYVSDQVHYCHEQAADVLGLGRESIRSVPTDDNYRLRTDSLANMITEDRLRGVRPLAIVATAGTVGTGAVDPIRELLKLSQSENIWLHVDGAYGAFAVLAESAPPDLRLIGEADSVACDPHKWLYAPIGAAVTLIRHPGALEESFRFRPPYLLQVDDPARIDLVDRSPENTRPFRALKVWLALRAYGVSGYASMIERNILLAGYLESLIDATPGLALAAPRELSIVCWRVEPEGVEMTYEERERLQTAVIGELEKHGEGFVSQAHLRDGRRALRACIVNFRTRPSDMEVLVEASARVGRELIA